MNETSSVNSPHVTAIFSAVGSRDNGADPLGLWPFCKKALKVWWNQPAVRAPLSSTVEGMAAVRRLTPGAGARPLSLPPFPYTRGPGTAAASAAARTHPPFLPYNRNWAWRRSRVAVADPRGPRLGRPRRRRGGGASNLGLSARAAALLRGRRETDGICGVLFLPVDPLLPADFHLHVPG